MRFELWPLCSIRFELRDGGAPLPPEDEIWGELRRAGSQAIRAVDHEGRLTGVDGYAKERIVEVSAPGVYEVHFEGVGADRFHPLPPRLIDVRAGETTDVILELRRK